MNYEGFNAMEFPIRCPVVYILFHVGNDGAEIPFYVGETESIYCRIADYLRSQSDDSSSAAHSPCDFKVAQAERYFREVKGHRTVVRYMETNRRKQEEKCWIDNLHRQGYVLLNDYPYEKRNGAVDKAKIKARVKQWCDLTLQFRARLARER